MLIFGVDPGLQGALALFDPAQPATSCVWDMPVKDGAVDPVGICALLDEQIKPERLPQLRVVIEKVHGLPRQAGVFNFGYGAGLVHGVLSTFALPIAFVSPQQWKQAMGLTHKDKNASRALAAQLFPALAERFKRVKDDGRAEALLLAVYFANKENR